MFILRIIIKVCIDADFECTTEKISSCQPSDRKSYTEKCQKHTACSFGYKVVCYYDEKYSGYVVIYRGEDCIEKFMKCMFEEVKNCQKIIRENFNKPLKMTKEDEEAFKKATHCHICEKKYKVDDKPVRDHCHVTGKYRGSAHETYQQKYQQKGLKYLLFFIILKVMTAILLSMN